ncbi:hypothetical protein ACP70R_004570 [Stipagrostis hirtigluma subsp. patula]
MMGTSTSFGDRVMFRRPGPRSLNWACQIKLGTLDSGLDHLFHLVAEAVGLSQPVLLVPWPDFCLCISQLNGAGSSRREPYTLVDDSRLDISRFELPKRGRGLVVVGEFGGTYEEGFEDVHKQIINFFTKKATNTVLYQLYEMNPPSYAWLYNYIVVNDPLDGDYFLRGLAKERQDLAERVMITRLHLYGKWIKKCDHAEMYQRIANENLEIMRQRLLETVVWPTDDTN